MDRKQFEEEQKLVDEAAWITQQMLKPTFVFRMARAMWSPEMWERSEPQRRGARKRLVNASREIVKLRDQWNHRVLNNSAGMSAMFGVLSTIFPDAQVNELNEKIIRELRNRGYRITKMGP